MDPRNTTPATTLHVRQAVGGDGKSLAWIFERFTPLVEAQVRMRLGSSSDRAEVEDLVSDTWVVTLQKLGDLSPRDGRLAPVLLRFLGTTAVQLCNNHLRRKIKLRARQSAASPASTEVSPDPFADVARETLGVVTRVGQSETLDAVRAALDELDEDRRGLLVLRLVEGRSNQEIAEILGEKPNTIAVRYRRALDALRDRVPKELLHDLMGF